MSGTEICDYEDLQWLNYNAFQSESQHVFIM
jgi:hypothetical protein